MDNKNKNKSNNKSNNIHNNNLDQNDNINFKEIKDTKDGLNKKKTIIKTYRDFAVEALKDNPISLAKMIIKEKRKKEYNYLYSSKSKKNILMITLSLILFVLGIITIGAIILFSSEKNSEIQNGKIAIDPKSVIYFDYKIENDATDATRSDIKEIFLNAIKNTNIPVGDLKIFYFIKRDNGIKKLISSQEFFEILDTRAPSQLLRNLKDEFSNGVVSTIDGAAPFLILGVNNFDVSYNFVLTWEKTLMSDMADLFGVNSKYNSQKFQDLDLYNKDTKSILDEEGKIIFGYSFIDLRTLVFFTSDKSFKKILSSFQKNKTRK